MNFATKNFTSRYTINQSINHLISEPNRPPSIYYQPPDVVYFKPGEAIELKCIADGMPLPK
jgi:hypothetical protein